MIVYTCFCLCLSLRLPFCRVPSIQGPVVQKPVTANLGLKLTNVSVSLVKKRFHRLILSHSLKAAKVKILGKANQQESTSLSYKTELKIDANPRLA